MLEHEARRGSVRDPRQCRAEELVGALIECSDEAKLNRSTEILRARVCAGCSILNTPAAFPLCNFAQTASANEQTLTPAKLKKLVCAVI
jgi:hypothetical protein